MVQPTGLGGQEMMAWLGLGLTVVIIVIMIIVCIVAVYAYFISKREPELELFSVDDYEQHEELAKSECPKECLNRELRLSGDGVNPKVTLGKIKGLRPIGTIQLEDESLDYLYMAMYIPKHKHELAEKLLKKRLHNLCFLQSESDGILGDITLRGVNIRARGRYNYLVSDKVRFNKMYDIIDNGLLMNRMVEYTENIKTLVQNAIRTDAKHQKTIEQNATVAQSPTMQPTSQQGK